MKQGPYERPIVEHLLRMGVPAEAIGDDGTVDVDLLRSMGWGVHDDGRLVRPPVDADSNSAIGEGYIAPEVPSVRLATRDEILAHLTAIGAPPEALRDDGTMDTELLVSLGLLVKHH